MSGVGRVLVMVRLVTWVSMGIFFFGFKAFVVRFSTSSLSFHIPSH